MKHQVFNLTYIDESGKEVRAYRRRDVRRIVFEDGREYGHSYVSSKMEYVGKKSAKTRYEINPVNGFKIRVNDNKALSCKKDT